MPAPRLHLPRGLPGSGKSTVARRLASQAPVVGDRTHLDPRAAARLRVLAPDARVVVHDLRHVDVETCIARDAARPDPLTRIGEDGIRAMWRRWIAPPVDDRPGVEPLVRPATVPSGAPRSPQAASGAFEAARDRRTAPRASESRTERPPSAGI